jgi:TP901 family phage tail tape measure protein
VADTSVLIKVGFQGAQALAGLDQVKDRFSRIGQGLDSIKDRFGRIGLGLNQLKEQFGHVGASIDQVRTKHKAMADQLRGERQALRSDAMDAIGLGALAFTPVKLSMDFESAMADVKKVVDFDTPDGFTKLSDEILRMSRHLPLSVEQLAQIAASGGQLGVAAKDIPAFVEQIAKMATAFDMSAESAGDSMAKLANVYNIPIAQISRLGDAINQLSNESPAKASDIVTTLGRIGGVAKQFGLTELQAASLSNAFISLGKAPEVAGTSINALLLKLQTADKQGAKFQSALMQMGMSASGLKRAIKNDAEGAIVGFLQAMGNVSSDKQLGLLVDLFGLEYADDIAVLAGSIKTYTDSIATAKGPNVDGSMDREFQERAKTTAANLQRLKNGFNEIGINIGSAVLPPLNRLLNTVLPVVGAVATWAKEHPKLMSALVTGMAGLAAYKLATIGVAYSLNLLRTGWAGLTYGIGLVRTIAPMAGTVLMGVGRAALFLGRALLLNPIGLAITAVAFLIYKFWGPIAGFFKGLWQGLAPIGAALTEAFAPLRVVLAPVVGLFKTLVGWVGSLFTPLKDTGGAAQSLGLKIGTGIATGIKAFIRLHQFVWGLPGMFLQLGADLVMGLVNGITNKIGQAKAAIIGMGQSIKGWFADTLGIKSPSRVFMGFGDNIGQGAQIGITRSIARVAQASGKLAQAARGAIAGAAMAGAASAGAAGGAGMVVHYSPNITVQGGAAEAVVPAMQQALKLSERDFEQMLNRVLDQRQRRNY